MANSKQIVYLSQAQYAELIANGTITVNGVTVTYDENDIYVTPQAEPVTDVQVNGTSVTANGVANVPTTFINRLGVCKPQTEYGIGVNANGDGGLKVESADSNLIKRGTGSGSLNKPIVPYFQHKSTFYGLTKAAGVDMANSDNEVGTYTPEAKGAIQKMLGVSDLIATEENNLTASKPYAIGDIFTANGKLYKATATIAQDAAIILPGEVGENCEEVSVADGFPHDVQVNGVSVVSNGVANVPIATSLQAGVVRGVGTFGISIGNGGIMIVNPPSNDEIKNGNDNFKPIVPSKQSQSTFYGLAKAAGDTTQAASDNAVGTYTDDAKTAIRTMLGAVGDVQVDGSSVVTNGVASIPIAQNHSGINDDYGLVKINNNNGIIIASDGCLTMSRPGEAGYKNGNNNYQAITPYGQHWATFYGLAKAAGHDEKNSTESFGTYTAEAKSAIQTMLGVDIPTIAAQVEIPLVETVTGTDVTITGQPNTRYVCGEVSSISITPPESGSVDVIFTSGTSVALLTLSSTVRMPDWFDATALETNTTYEILITDGVYGSVMTWQA